MTRTRRRGPSEGSIYWRKSDGRWVGSVHIGYEGGRRIRKTVYGATRAEAAAKLRKVQSAVEHGTFVHDERRTVGQYLDWWVDHVLAGLEGTTIKASTADSYRQMINLYLKPALGDVRLAKLSALQVQEMLTAMERRGLSAATRRKARAVLSRALAYAERNDLVRRNAAKLSEPPAGVNHRLDDTLTLDEARALIAAAKGDPDMPPKGDALRSQQQLETVVTVALTLGLRKGELLGLRWRHVDLDAGTLTVATTLQYRRGQGLVESTPKTARSARTVALPQTCVRALEQHRRRQAAARLAAGAAWADEDYVFTTSVGTPIDPQNLLRSFQRLCEKAGIGRRRFHALRHSAATLMLAQGVPLAVISNVLGHSGIAITADVYARVGAELHQQAADAMDAVFG